MNTSDDSFQSQSQFNKIFQGVGSLGAIFVCQTQHARDLVELKKNGIQAVLSCQKGQKINLPQRQIPSYLYLEIQDDIDFNIAQFFEESFKFIEQNRRKTHILIHCQKGDNCSVALVIAYLIKKYQYTYHQALLLVKRRYLKFSNNSFNQGFAHQLEYFAVQNGDFNMVKSDHLRRKIQRVRRTYDGIARSYSKQLNMQQKLMGIRSTQKNKSKSLKGKIQSMQKLKSLQLLPYQSKNKFNQNPQEATQCSRQVSKEYMKFVPQKSQQQIQDQQHHKKIVSQIFLLSEQSRIYLSRRMESMRSDNSTMKNYDRLINGKKNHITYYSPLKKLQKYEMFTQGKLNKQFYNVLTNNY